MSTTQKPINPLFTRQALVALLLPLIAEQALSVTIGLADTLIASLVQLRQTVESVVQFVQGAASGTQSAS